ncbi:MAG: hypothetical protein LAQ69_05220 [Acidobacteriia bacterium]|nr:hypothetical protein [Terriglobia bacterium]
MRYLLAYQLASWAVVWISVNKLSFRRLIGFAPVGFLSIVALVAATDIKTNGGLQQLSIRNALYSLNTMVARYASFHADAVISLSPQLEGYVLQRRDVVVADILGGIPFTGLSAGKPWANDVSFDMGLHQTILHATERTSFFVPLLTSVRYAFGIPYATVIAILAGWLHAIVARRCLGHPSREAWILQQAMMLPISLHGLARGDLFRPLVNTWLCALLLRVTLASSPQRVHARRREYSSQAATR